MEREDILKFTNFVVLLSKLLTTIEDIFLKEKLHGKISDLVIAFVEQKSIHSPMSHNLINLINSINNLLDYLEYLAHISKSNATPLLLAQRNLLKLKLYILKRNKTKEVSKTSDVAPTTENRLRTGPYPGSDAVNLATSKPSRKPARFALRADSNKGRIFNYIKKTPKVRTKDVMHEFSALSGRTVKRSLKELTDDGFLTKRLDGIAVYYFINSK